MRKFVITILFSGVFMPCLAAQKNDCGSQTDNQSLYECAMQEFKEQDNLLNITYNRLLKMLDKEGAEKLQAAQKAWIAFRDLNSEYYADFFRGGTASRIEGVGSTALMTKARTQELLDEIKRRESLGFK